MVYDQGDNFTAPNDLSGPTPGVVQFDFPGYVNDTKLGPLVAGIYYQVEEGVATVSIPSTSPVVTSTLPAAHSTGSGTSSGTGSGSKPTNTSNTGGAMGKVITGSLLGLTIVLSYTML